MRASPTILEIAFGVALGWLFVAIFRGLVALIFLVLGLMAGHPS